MVIFHSYVSLPEGKSICVKIHCKNLQHTGNTPKNFCELIDFPKTWHWHWWTMTMVILRSLKVLLADKVGSFWTQLKVGQPTNHAIDFHEPCHVRRPLRRWSHQVVSTCRCQRWLCRDHSPNPSPADDWTLPCKCSQETTGNPRSPKCSLINCAEIMHK